MDIKNSISKKDNYYQPKNVEINEINRLKTKFSLNQN